MKKKVLSFLVFGSLLLAATPKVSTAACATGNLSCYSGYTVCGSSTGAMVEAMMAAEAAICN